jgi:hypothetical protein
MRNIYSIFAAGSALMLSACSAAEAPAAGPPPAFPTGVLALPCPMAPSGTDAGALAAAPRVYLEFAAFEGTPGDVRAQPSSSVVSFFEHGMNDSRSGARHSGAMLLTNDTVSKMPWHLGGGAVGEPDSGRSSVSELVVTARVAPEPSQELRLEVAVERAQASDPSREQPTASPRGPRTTLVLTDQRAAVLGFDPAITEAGGSGGMTLLLTPYIIRRDDDLRRLFECKMAQRARAPR